MMVYLTINIEKYISDINDMKVNVLKGKPALKKPLLLLLVISKFEEGYFSDNKITFDDIEKELTELIENYGGRPSSSGAKANQPFQYMNSAPFWNINLPLGIKMTHSRDLSLKILKQKDTYVTLDEKLYVSLKESSRTRAILSNFILQKWWPETVQEELRNVLKLPIETFVKTKNNRSKDFANLVLANFRYRCAFCGFSSTFNKYSFGIDGAHIQWFSQNGPDTIDNGLSLCKLHHWAFDRGVLSVHPEKLEILVSSKFVGQDEQSMRIIEGLHGEVLYPFKEIRPNQSFLEWHNDCIFIG